MGGADEEDGGTLGRGEGAREEGEEESGDDLEFHDAHSELPGTILDYVCHRQSENGVQKLANWLLNIHEGIRPCDAKRKKMRSVCAVAIVYIIMCEKRVLFQRWSF